MDDKEYGKDNMSAFLIKINHNPEPHRNIYK